MRRGAGGTPCIKPTVCHHVAAAVLPVYWQNENGGLIGSAISFRFRRSRRSGENGGLSMWRLLPQGGDFFRREKYYPALDRPQATADAVRQSFQRQKEKSAFGSPGRLCPLEKAPFRTLLDSFSFSFPCSLSSA